MANHRRNVRKAAKKYPTLFLVLGILVAIAVIVLLVLYFMKIGPFKPKPESEAPGDGIVTEVADADLSIHFLELGNKYTGDCTLIKCGDTEVLIDAGSRKNSAATIKSYVDEYCTDGILEYVIATHAHQDHIAGFVGNTDGDGRTGILYQYKVGTLIQFSGTDTTSQIYGNYLNAIK